MNPNQNSQDEWIACQQGEIGQLAQQLKHRRRTQFIQRNATIVVLLVTVASAGYVFVDNRSRSDLEFGGITCSEVSQHANEFVAKTLEPALEKKIRQHLAHCPECRERLEQLRLKTGRPPAKSSRVEKKPMVVVAMVAKRNELAAASFSY